MKHDKYMGMDVYQATTVLAAAPAMVARTPDTRFSENPSHGGSGHGELLRFNCLFEGEALSCCCTWMVYEVSENHPTDAHLST